MNKICDCRLCQSARNYEISKRRERRWKWIRDLFRF